MGITVRALTAERQARESRDLDEALQVIAFCSGRRLEIKRIVNRYVVGGDLKRIELLTQREFLRRLGIREGRGRLSALLILTCGELTFDVVQTVVKGL